jgi:hypothetical protein
LCAVPIAVSPQVRILTDADGRGGVLLDSTRGIYLLLNRSGVEIWTALAEGCQPDEVVATLTERRQQPEEEAAKEVEAFVRDLVRRGMLHET